MLGFLAELPSRNIDVPQDIISDGQILFHLVNQLVQLLSLTLTTTTPIPTSLPTSIPRLTGPFSSLALAGGLRVVIFGYSDIGPVKQFHIFEIEGLLARGMILVEGEGMHGGSEERINLNGLGECRSMGCQVIGCVIFLVPIQGLQKKVEAAFLDFSLILFELPHTFGGLTDLGEHTN